jgi:hypothetical protein
LVHFVDGFFMVHGGPIGTSSVSRFGIFVLVRTTEPSAPAKKFCRKSLFPAFLFHLRMNLLLEINYK